MGKSVESALSALAAIFFWLLSISAFLVKEGVYFLQNANNLNLKLFFIGFICIVSYNVYMVLLSRKLTFKSWILTSEKSCTSCPNWEEVIWTESKRTTFSMRTSLSGHICNPPSGDYWLDQGGCDWKCKGDSSQICGGNWRMNVYQTGFKIWISCKGKHP